MSYFTSKRVFLHPNPQNFFWGVKEGARGAQCPTSTGQEDLDLAPPTPLLLWESPDGHGE